MKRSGVHSTKLNYLNKEQIEIVDDPTEIKRIVQVRKQQLAADMSPDFHKIGKVFSDEYLEVHRDPVRFPSGKVGTYLRIVERSSIDGISGVVMLPFDGKYIYLLELFRHPTRSWEIELPRGFRPKGFTAEQTVRQEMAEEVGLPIKKITELGFINANSGLFASKAQAFLVKLEGGKSTPKPEKTEVIRSVQRLSLLQVFDMIRAGQIRDGFTLSTFQLAQAHGVLPIP